MHFLAVRFKLNKNTGREILSQLSCNCQIYLLGHTRTTQTSTRRRSPRIYYVQHVRDQHDRVVKIRYWRRTMSRSSCRRFYSRGVPKPNPCHHVWPCLQVVASWPCQWRPFEEHSYVCIWLLIQFVIYVISWRMPPKVHSRKPINYPSILLCKQCAFPVLSKPSQGIL
jgi:hypothetical protein